MKEQNINSRGKISGATSEEEQSGYLRSNQKPAVSGFPEAITDGKRPGAVIPQWPG